MCSVSFMTTSTFFHTLAVPTWNRHVLQLTNIIPMLMFRTTSGFALHDFLISFLTTLFFVYTSCFSFVLSGCTYNFKLLFSIGPWISWIFFCPRITPFNGSFSFAVSQETKSTYLCLNSRFLWRWKHQMFICKLYLICIEHIRLFVNYILYV